MSANDYGMKGSVPGYEITSVIDYLQQFSSSWPHLKIHSTGIFGGTVTHNLGYPPFHFLARSDGRIDQFSGVDFDSYGVDDSVLARTSGSDNPRYFICLLPLNQDFDAQNITGQITKTTIDHDFGIKVSKPGKDVNSTDMRDFALHSSTRSLMVDRVKYAAMANTGGGLGWEYTLSHGLGYTPIAFVFVLVSTNTLGLASGRFVMVPPPVGVSGAYYTVTNSTVYITLDATYFTATPFVSIVVLKDPFDKEAVTITFP